MWHLRDLSSLIPFLGSDALLESIQFALGDFVVMLVDQIVHLVGELLDLLFGHRLILIRLEQSRETKCRDACRPLCSGCNRASKFREIRLNFFTTQLTSLLPVLFGHSLIELIKNLLSSFRTVTSGVDQLQKTLTIRLYFLFSHGLVHISLGEQCTDPVTDKSASCQTNYFPPLYVALTVLEEFTEQTTLFCSSDLTRLLPILFCNSIVEFAQ